MKSENTVVKSIIFSSRIYIYFNQRKHCSAAVVIDGEFVTIKIICKLMTLTLLNTHVFEFQKYCNYIAQLVIRAK